MSKLDLDALDTPDIRDVLKCRSHLLRVGIPADFAAVKTLTVLIDGYRKRVGLATYLSEMLDGLASAPVGECEIYTMDGLRVVAQGNEPIQKYLRRLDWLPFKVVVGEETKYL